MDSIEESSGYSKAQSEGSHKKIPVMLVGNKTDMRDEMIKEKKRVVKEHDGQRLARVSFVIVLCIRTSLSLFSSLSIHLLDTIYASVDHW